MAKLVFQTDGRIRLDQLLAERGDFPSRSRARDAILRGAVSEASGRVFDKPGLAVDRSIEIRVNDPAAGYVSRAALKLAAGLDHFGLDPSGRRCLDIGASTGGFTQVLLERGAASVIAVDTGHGQMDPLVAGDPRVTLHEGLNARNLDADIFLNGLPEFVVCDVSFISLKIALGPALAMAVPGAAGLFLVKPQFEAGPGALGKNGIVKDIKLADRIVADMEQWLGRQDGWRALGQIRSPIEGGDGNREFLLAGRKNP